MVLTYYVPPPPPPPPPLLLVFALTVLQSLDQQLYTERWAPTPSQVLKLALDVARGMEHLHTAFEREGHDQPLIHRDLKSPNLLLAQPPPPPAHTPADGEGGEILVKIADFGLSKDSARPRARLLCVCPAQLIPVVVRRVVRQRQAHGGDDRLWIHPVDGSGDPPGRQV
eukprot:COSAG01_NODE_4272_length_5193_cov_7.742638_5_plen_169_part_00